MDITVSARHMDISPALRTAAEQKIGRLSRFGARIRRAEVHFFEEQNPRIADKEVCEVTLEGDRARLHCKVAASHPFAAIDLAVAKLEPQLHKLKVKGLMRKQLGPRRPVEVPASTDLSQVLAADG